MSVQKLITEHLDLWTGATTHAANSRGKNGKVELTGIQKLRELILELGVHGKLVEQDPEDTPAPQLLTEISEHRKELIKRKEIKNSKPLPPVLDNEAPSALPDGWAWTRLETIAEISPRNSAEDTTEASFVPMPLVTTSHRGQHEEEPRTWVNIKKGYSHFADGDIGLAKITPCFENSKAAVFRNLRNGIGAGTTELHVARPLSTAIDPYFILLFLKSPKYLNEGEQVMTGSAGQKRVPKDYFSETPLPLPPQEEQHRIVQKVDELMALCDRLEQQTSDQLEAHETLVDTLLNTLTQSENATELGDNWVRLAAHFDNLLTTEQSIDKLKQTFLQLAVMGQLVAQHGDDEPAETLLSTIDKERKALHETGKIKKPRSLPSIEEHEKPFRLPKGWAWCRFGNTGYTRLGKMLDKVKNSGTQKPYLRNTNVQWWHVDLSEIKTLKLETHELDEYRVCYGDLLICEGGEPGRCLVWRYENKEMYFQKALHRHRTLGLCSPDYLKICLTVDYQNGRLAHFFTGATIKHLPGDNLAKYVCPIPPLSEQYRIVHKVDELMALCERLKEHLNQANKTRCQLAETVVEGALQT